MSSLQFKVTRMPAVLVEPSLPTPKEFLYLSNIDDQATLRFYSPIIQFYRFDKGWPGFSCSTTLSPEESEMHLPVSSWWSAPEKACCLWKPMQTLLLTNSETSSRPFLAGKICCTTCPTHRLLPILLSFSFRLIHSCSDS